MAELLHLRTPWDVDRHIVKEQKKLVLVRFSQYEEAEPLLWRRLREERRQEVEAAALGKRTRDGDRDDDPEACLPVSPLDTMTAEDKSMRTKHAELCAAMDAALVELAPLVRNFCTVYAVDTIEVPEFNHLYALDDPDDTFAVMFFFRNRHIKVDLGTGNKDKLNFLPPGSVKDILPIVDSAYKAGVEGKSQCSTERRFQNVGARQA